MELAAAMDLAAEFAQKIVVERAVTAREIEVSVLGNDDIRASIPGEIVPHREFYDYAAKYLEEGTRLLIPAPLTKTQVAHFRITPCAPSARLTARAWRAAISSSKIAPERFS